MDSISSCGNRNFIDRIATSFWRKIDRISPGCLYKIHNIRWSKKLWAKIDRISSCSLHKSPNIRWSQNIFGQKWTEFPPFLYIKCIKSDGHKKKWTILGKSNGLKMFLGKFRANLSEPPIFGKSNGLKIFWGKFRANLSDAPSSKTYFVARSGDDDVDAPPRPCPLPAPIQATDFWGCPWQGWGQLGARGEFGLLIPW